MIKTNVMRKLDQAKIPYRSKEYEIDEQNLGGPHVAKLIGMPPEQVFKTLVTRGEKRGILVFCVPINMELDLKKAAKEVKDKKIEMIHMKELLGLTGYIRGGVSPIGMKKKYPIYIDETAVLYDEISISAGIRGCQVILNPESLKNCIDGEFVDVAK